MSAYGQRGGSTLAAVMMLLVMGLMLLNAQHRQLDSALLLAADEKRYLQAYNQAASALSWGVAQSWPRGRLATNGWWCQQASELRACAKLSAQAGIVLVRGDALVNHDEPLRLYQRAKPDGVGGDISLRAETGGWLDFCPEKKQADCAE
ncbi:YgdB family protein [Pseudomonas lundensis]|uniref:YgdB family protein n=1 Tax=Serratia proteamaculans TaxID=28151 RepID=UPI0029815B96|nr:YgdB family protein [Serratia proteamaculans]MDW5501962.1 YgdB family protein [Serratia proteamaculans]MDW5507022.1 YgdB family protein [Pseudomonas lundensis]